MNDQPIRTAKHWRDKATETRALAGKAKAVDLKEALRRIADSYDELAKKLEGETRSPEDR